MKKFNTLNLKGPATLEAVLNSVVYLSAHDEAEIQEFASTGKLRELFPFRPSKVDQPIADFESEENLIAASAAPLSRAARKHLIESSMRDQNPQSVFSESDAQADFLVLADKLRSTT